MGDGYVGSVSDLDGATDIAGGDDVGCELFDVGDLSVAQLSGDVGLQDIVGSGRSAAQMGLARGAYAVSGAREQALGGVGHLLAVLEGAGGVVGDGEPASALGERQVDPVEELADVPGERGDAGGLAGISGVGAQQEAVILDRGAAAGCGDEDRVQPFALHLAGPGIDVAPRGLQARFLAAHMVDERAAADLAGRERHRIARAVQQAHGGGADLGLQHRLRAALQQRDPALEMGDGGGLARRLRGQLVRRQRQHGGERLERAHAPEQGGRRPGQPRQAQGEAEARGIGQHGGEQGADQPVA